MYPNANFVLDQPTVHRLVRQQAFSILGPLAMASDSKSMFPTSQGCIDDQVRGASVDAFSGVKSFTKFDKVAVCSHFFFTVADFYPARPAKFKNPAPC